jgi:protein-L-isoaspartate(D-aspartate) O-methyltransferase
VIEIGTGCGYQTAVLSLLAREVISIEKVPGLARSAQERLARLGFSNVQVVVGDGSIGLPARAPYEAVLVTAGAPSLPPPLLNELAEGGRLIIPVGQADRQELLRVTKRNGNILKESLMSCRFVPLLGRYGWDRKSQELSAG